MNHALCVSLLAASISMVLLAGCSTTASKTAAAPPGSCQVYIASGGTNQIIRYELEMKTGNLLSLPAVDLPGSPGPLAVDPTQRRLYAGLRNSKAVAVYHISGADGSLERIGATPIVANPVYLSIDRSNRYLLTADYGANLAATYALKPDGAVSEQPIVKLDLPKNPHSIVADASNQFVFVPTCGADQVLQFKLEPDGKLTPNAPPSVATQPVDGPRHPAFHPTLPYFYVVNEKSSSVTAYQFDRAGGTIKPMQTLSTLPPHSIVKNTCADIHITPNGKFLYCSNRGHDSIAGYSIDPPTGKLTALGQTPTEKTPRAFQIDPTGKFLIAAGQGSDKISIYRINTFNGALQTIGSYPAGKGPAWVLILNPRNPGD